MPVVAAVVGAVVTVGGSVATTVVQGEQMKDAAENAKDQKVRDLRMDTEATVANGYARSTQRLL